MKNLKILFFNHSLGAGGSERVISQITNYLIKKNFNISILTIAGNNIDDFYDLNPEIKRYKLGLSEKKIECNIKDALQY